MAHLNFLFQYLKGRCHGNHFCVIPDIFARSQSISGSAGPIFTVFAPYGRYWTADDQFDLLFFRYLKGCCHGNQFCAALYRLDSFVYIVHSYFTLCHFNYEFVTRTVYLVFCWFPLECISYTCLSNRKGISFRTYFNYSKGSFLWTDYNRHIVIVTLTKISTNKSHCVCGTVQASNIYIQLRDPAQQVSYSSRISSFTCTCSYWRVCCKKIASCIYLFILSVVHEVQKR